MEKGAHKTKKDSDASVQKMIEEWDIVVCHICKKKISMLDAKMTHDGKHFVCKNH